MEKKLDILSWILKSLTFSVKTSGMWLSNAGVILLATTATMLYSADKAIIRDAFSSSGKGDPSLILLLLVTGPVLILVGYSLYSSQFEDRQRIASQPKDPPEERVKCTQCGKAILISTAKKRDGLCTPCHKASL